MEWEKLLSLEKLKKEPPHPDDKFFKAYPLNGFEKDISKIISSAAFRRLQDKTQVFPLDKSDFIRTRLTHSIEVSTIARHLGMMLIDSEKDEYKLDDDTKAKMKYVPLVLSCAGLLHDLGNPPFGHFGEFVIGDWFRNYFKEAKYKDGYVKDNLTEQMIKDLEKYEGNAQTFRILAKARNDSEINISLAVISTLIKYPTNSVSFNAEDEDIKNHKFGYFFSEEEVFSELCEKLGVKNSAGEINRHPLAFLLEAADDIAYATSDLEDAFKKGLFSIDEFIQYFKSQYKPEDVKVPNPENYSELLINDLEKRTKCKSKKGDAEIFKDWLEHVKNWLMYVAAYRFCKNYNDIMAGRYKKDLFHNTYHEKSIKILKDAMKKFVFNNSGILKLELSSSTILSFLLDKFVNAFLYYDSNDEYKPTKADKKIIEIFSPNYKKDYEKCKKHDEYTNLYLRLLMVADYISGMTDTFARTLYRELNGVD